jgi:type IV pilus assembly protein PilO
MAKSFNDLATPVQAGILIAVPALLALGFFVEGIPTVVSGVWPLHSKQQALHQQYLSLKAQNDQNEAFRQQKVEYENRLRQAQEQSETQRLLLPAEPRTDEFMRSVFEAGTSNNINVRTFVPQPQVTKDVYVEVPFKVRLDGTYYSLLSFFDRLAHEQRIVSVTGLSLGAPEGGGMGAYTVRPGETVGADCVITTYYNRATPPPPSIKK